MPTNIRAGLCNRSMIMMCTQDAVRGGCLEHPHLWPLVWPPASSWLFTTAEESGSRICGWDVIARLLSPSRVFFEAQTSWCCLLLSPPSLAFPPFYPRPNSSTTLLLACVAGERCNTRCLTICTCSCFFDFDIT